MSSKQKAPASPANPSKRQCKVLTLAEKIRVIDAVENGMSNRAVAEKFQCGHTQVNSIILQQDSIKQAYQNGVNASTKYLAPRNMLYCQSQEHPCQWTHATK